MYRTAATWNAFAIAPAQIGGRPRRPDEENNGTGLWAAAFASGS